MTSPSNEPPRHSREFDPGYGGDEHNPSTGPIPAAEPNSSPSGSAGETHVLPALTDGTTELSGNPRDLQPLEREALGASSGELGGPTEQKEQGGQQLAPAAPADAAQEPVWPTARLGENFESFGGEAPESSGPPSSTTPPTPVPPYQDSAVQAGSAGPQGESLWRTAADHGQLHPRTQPPSNRPQAAPQYPTQSAAAPVSGGPAGSSVPLGPGVPIPQGGGQNSRTGPSFGAPPLNAPGHYSQPSAPGTPYGSWGQSVQPPQQQPRVAPDLYAPSTHPAPAAGVGPIQPPWPVQTAHPQPQSLAPGARAAAASAQRRASVVESLGTLDSAPGRVRMSEAQWGEELARVKRPAPETGWRAAVYKGSFHLINPGRSRKEKDLADWVSTIQSPLRGRYRIAVISTRGGLGKTTAAVGTASGFAKHRLEDRTIVVDADPGYGSLADRIDPTASGSLLTVLDSGNRGMLGSDDQIRAHVGANSLGLMVLAGDSRLTNRPQLTPEIYHQAMPHVEKFYRVIFVDCGPAIDHPVMPEILANVDALIVVSSTKADGAKGAGVTLDWLSENNYHDLLKRTVVVINDLKGNSAKKIRNKLQEKFGDVVDDVFVVPFDKHLDEATVIDLDGGLKSKTRRKFVEIAAAIANNFASTTDLSHD
ncbi:AAA family ATPase [Mycobacterium sp. D16R24]|uniref:nucleotide-binding protein n=1 Tax=Mycobacterium sp. D16R24 TaxID=1855656 RepID=UPI001591C602|nr:AAA family ATPase [Mycobacterium sp. D16R24]